MYGVYTALQGFGVGGGPTTDMVRDEVPAMAKKAVRVTDRPRTDESRIMLKLVNVRLHGKRKTWCMKGKRGV